MKHRFEVHDTHDKALTAARRWKAQYGHYPATYRVAGGESPFETLAKLEALGDKATPTKVNKIIGNESWTKAFCCNCSEYFDRGVSFDTGDGSAEVCLPCLRAAVRKASK